jgi:hypothetical protein
MEKSEVVTFRLSKADKAAAIKAASAEGRKLSSWLQHLVRGNLTRKAKRK